MKPNIIFLMDDQHRWDAMGHVDPLVKTPALDRLAADGVSFRQAVCQAPMCIASRNSMMFGMYPNALGVLRNEPGIPDALLPAVPLPELLRKAGYQTAGFGKTHWGLLCSSRGFEVRYEGECPETGAVMMTEDAPEAKRLYDAEIGPYGGGEENNAGYVGCTSRLPEAYHRDGWVAGKCLEFIESGIDTQRPLFLYLSFFKPHAGHNIPEGYEEQYDFETLDYAIQPPWDREVSPHAAGNNRNARYEAFWQDADPATWRLMTGRYHANCTWLDALFGRALAALAAKGCLENALVVYCSDHGEMLGERHYRFNKYCLYESSVRVPMLLSGSALPPGLRGVVDERPAELVDLYPTLAKVAGIAIPETAQGLDLLSGQARAGGFCALHERPDEAAFMWRTSGYKLILVMRRKACAADYTDRDVICGEFYDLAQDPREWDNLYDKSGSHAVIMQTMAAALMAKVGAAPVGPQSRRDWATISSVETRQRMHTQTPVSLFNDVLGPVMRGPSSSHCAAALRIGRIARDLMGGVMSEVLVEFDRNGSLPTTHATQGSDMGLFGGLLGWDADDERLPDSATALADAGIALQFRTVEAGDPHPNTYRLTLRSPDEEHSLIAVSTGGGMIQVLSIDGAPVAMDGGTFETLVWLPREAVVSALGCEVLEHAAGTVRLVQVSGDAFATLEFTGEDDGALRCCVSAGGVRQGDTPPSTPRPGGTGGVAATFEPARVRRIAPVLPVLSRRGVRVPFTTCAQMLADNADRNASLWQLAIEYESARSGLDEAAIMERMFQIVRILRRSLAEGLAGTSYEDRILGVQSDRFAATMKSGRLLDAGALNRMLLNVTALMEVKSAMGVIVAMPTAGACAALPGAVLGMADELHRQEHEVARAFLAGGLVGVFIATAWSFAAETGGCQAECGSASAMAAAALVTLADGTLQQALSASSMALQNMLGLVCDPVANRVEAPCLGKNAMAAANALSCANMALAGYDELIPLDEVIGAAKRVGEQLPKELRCTALGGLSVTPTSKAIEQRLFARCRRDD